MALAPLIDYSSAKLTSSTLSLPCSASTIFHEWQEVTLDCLYHFPTWSPTPTSFECRLKLGSVLMMARIVMSQQLLQLIKPYYNVGIMIRSIAAQDASEESKRLQPWGITSLSQPRCSQMQSFRLPVSSSALYITTLINWPSQLKLDSHLLLLHVALYPPHSLSAMPTITNTPCTLSSTQKKEPAMDADS